MPNSVLRVLVAGSYIIDDGYPNVKWLLKAMEEEVRFSVSYAGRGHSRQKHFSRRGQGFLKLLMRSIPMLFKLWKELFVVLWRRDTAFDVLYVPYPAPFMLWLLSFIPRQYRPIIVADTFISLFDTVVNDRKMLSEGSFISLLLLKFEKRALHAADAVLTDTECNRKFLEELFHLPPEKIQALPLATDEYHYFPQKYHADKRGCTVLFVGTFVPLHGVETIAHTILLLAEEEGIQFRIFGDGQSATAVAEILKQGECDVQWQREWESPSFLAKEISNADVCLGVFGTTAKAARVWPLKNYVAMCVGRAIISERTACVFGLEKKDESLPVCMVPAGDARALADRILQLARNPEKRVHMADLARSYYQQHMSNDKVLDVLFETMRSLTKKVAQD